METPTTIAAALDVLEETIAADLPPARLRGLAHTRAQLVEVRAQIAAAEADLVRWDGQIADVTLATEVNEASDLMAFALAAGAQTKVKLLEGKQSQAKARLRALRLDEEALTEKIERAEDRVRGIRETIDQVRAGVLVDPGPRYPGQPRTVADLEQMIAEITGDDAPAAAA